MSTPASPAGRPGPAEPARILVVDDDPTVAEVVTGYLRRAGHTVGHAADGPGALAQAAADPPELVVLDLMLPGIDGLEVCRRLRAERPVPVIMLTARGAEEDRIAGLELGADDYVTKPFSPRELVLRVESVLRRSRPGAEATVVRAPAPLRAAGITVDPVTRKATRHGAELALTLREFDLLAHFLSHPGRAHTREELMREVWGWDFGDLSTVTVHVRRLRAKIEEDPAVPRLIQTVWGVGYRFEAGADAGADAGAAAGAGAEVGAAAAAGAAPPDTASGPPYVTPAAPHAATPPCAAPVRPATPPGGRS
ncbi:response regulator transcription factor [Streptomyces sp. NPDC101132]|uniref:response regulator transcription factor n=1 Tax=Streptomyces sp. NPDC101132 TaxID=3366110 RepID=UPI003805F091